MGRNREQIKNIKWNKKSSEKEILYSKYIRNKIKMFERNKQTVTKHSINRYQTSLTDNK